MRKTLDIHNEYEILKDFHSILHDFCLTIKA